MAGWDAARATDMLQVFEVGQKRGAHCCRTHCCWGGERWVVCQACNQVFRLMILPCRFCVGGFSGHTDGRALSPPPPLLPCASFVGAGVPTVPEHLAAFIASEAVNKCLKGALTISKTVVSFVSRVP